MAQNSVTVTTVTRTCDTCGKPATIVTPVTPEILAAAAGWYVFNKENLNEEGTGIVVRSAEACSAACAIAIVNSDKLDLPLAPDSDPIDFAKVN